jgi:F0F1-type ATP synthase delta subunit
MIAKILILQLIVAVAVIFVLKKLLDKELKQAALEHAIVFRPSEAALKVERITIVSAVKLALDYRAKLLAILKEKCPQASIDFLENAALRGGLVVEIGEEVWDHSLETRLKHLFERAA